MTTLIVFTAFSKLLVGIAIREIRQLADDVIVVDFSDDIHKALKDFKISSFPIRASGYKSWPERDVAFKRDFMPGKQLDFDIPTTELKIWKMAALDRWSFWYRGLQAKKEYEYLMTMRWDRAIVPADMHHPLPWTLARHSGKPITAVKAGSFRTREWHDALVAKTVPFDAVIADLESDIAFLKTYGYAGRLELIA